MKAILAINNKNYIGLNGELPWKSSQDLKHFKEMTNGCKLLVGYNTALKLPKLSNREVIIDPRGELYPVTDDMWCIGGKKTYEKYVHWFTELHISHINDDTIGDVKAPDLINLLDPACKIHHYYFDVD